MFDFGQIKNLLNLSNSKIRNFLLTQNSREILIFVFFLFVSFFFWGLRTLNETYQSELEIPFEITHVPENVIITSEVPTSVRLKVEDRGTVLLNYLLGKTFVPVRVDYNSFVRKGSRMSISAYEVQKLVATQLNSTTKLLSIRPDVFDYFIAQGSGKTVPVVLNARKDTYNQYYVSSVRFEPETVKVYAPEHLADSLMAASVEDVSMKGITGNYTQKVKIVSRPGVKFVPDEVNMKVEVDVYSEKTVEVPILGIDFPEGKTLRTFPSRVQVSFQVGLKSFKTVTAEDFLVTVSYADVLKHQGDKVPLTLKVAPDNINHPRLSVKEVEYLIEERNTNE